MRDVSEERRDRVVGEGHEQLRDEEVGPAVHEEEPQHGAVHQQLRDPQDGQSQFVAAAVRCRQRVQRAEQRLLGQQRPDALRRDVQLVPDDADLPKGLADVGDQASLAVLADFEGYLRTH